MRTRSKAIINIWNAIIRHICLFIQLDKCTSLIVPVSPSFATISVAEYLPKQNTNVMDFYLFVTSLVCLHAHGSVIDMCWSTPANQWHILLNSWSLFLWRISHIHNIDITWCIPSGNLAAVKFHYGRCGIIDIIGDNCRKIMCFWKISLACVWNSIIFKYLSIYSLVSYGPVELIDNFLYPIIWHDIEILHHESW